MHIWTCSQGNSVRQTFDTNGENGCDDKDDSVSGEVSATKNFTLKEFSEVLKV